MKRSFLLAARKRSLALNVHFKHPDLGMKEYEILSRATAFLLSVDPPNESNESLSSSSSSSSSSAYSHIVRSQRERENIKLKQGYSPDPVGGPQRNVQELGWLEFCPGQFRPLAHVCAASHVLSPWLWKQYYPQPWLEKITQDHVRYSVSVYDADDDNNGNNSSIPNESLATFGLNPYPIHHPNNMDLAIVHLKSEEATLKQLDSLGVDILHLTDEQATFQKDDEVLFEGFEIMEDQHENLQEMSGVFKAEQMQKESDKNDDTRIFSPYDMKGNLIYASPERFLAKTATPLPEGVCGGPVIDNNGRVCGIVEGIVPTDHEEKEMAGAASFIPYFRVKEFIQYAERQMLEKIVPKSLYDKVVDLKDGKALNEGNTSFGDQSSLNNQEESSNLDKTYSEMIESIRHTRSPEQVEAIMGTIEREREEVFEMVEQQGGDLDEIIAKVRSKTREKQREIVEQLNQVSHEEKKDDGN